MHRVYYRSDFTDEWLARLLTYGTTIILLGGRSIRNDNLDLCIVAHECFVALVTCFVHKGFGLAGESPIINWSKQPRPPLGGAVAENIGPLTLYSESTLKADSVDP